MKKFFKKFLGWVLFIFGIILVSIFGIFYFLILGFNWVVKKIFRIKKDLIPIEDWLDKIFL